MMGFHSHEGTPIAGWFLLGKIPSFEMDDDWRYPYFRKPINDGIPKFAGELVENPNLKWMMLCGYHFRTPP